MILSLLIIVFVISVASTWWFGLWSNLITLVNLLLSAMVASSFFTNFSYQLEKRLESFSLILPFISLWLLFFVTFMVLRGLTDTLSNMRLKFDNITEMIGRSLLSVVVAWVLVCFVSFSLQLAPLKESLFSGKETNDIVFDARKPDGYASVTFGPEMAWANFVASRSDGSLSYPVEETMFFPRLQAYGDEALKSPNRVFPAAMIPYSGVAIRTQVSASKTLRISEEFLKARREILETLRKRKEKEKAEAAEANNTKTETDGTSTDGNDQ